jgi:hypothetical protein
MCGSACVTFHCMPRPKRADEANGVYHALNRGNARAEVFRKPEDYGRNKGTQLFILAMA